MADSNEWVVEARFGLLNAYIYTATIDDLMAH
jgi:hypothetical protein